MEKRLSGGNTSYPTYKEVCTNETGHAEVIEIEFDPSKISYETLLHKFFDLHDPTTLNRQGPDVGTQYRSVIFYHSAAQQEKSEQIKSELDRGGKFKRPIVTQIQSAPIFYAAEEYHQKYLAKRGQTHCGI